MKQKIKVNNTVKNNAQNPNMFFLSFKLRMDKIQLMISNGTIR